MNLILTVLLSILLSIALSLIFKKFNILLLTMLGPLVIGIEVLITKDISAFYYRYYYHWLFLIPLFLVLPFVFLKEIKKASILIKIFFIIWIVIIGIFPMKTVLNNIKYLNTDTMWFDQFAKKYALKENNIYDYISWRYPKTKDIIYWCENQEKIIKLYHLDPKSSGLDDESGLHAFFVKCDYKDLNPESEKSVEEAAVDLLRNYRGNYYFSLEKCQKQVSNPYADSFNQRRYELNQRLVCVLKEIKPYLYFFPD